MLGFDRDSARTGSPEADSRSQANRTPRSSTLREVGEGWPWTLAFGGGNLDRRRNRASRDEEDDHGEPVSRRRTSVPPLRALRMQRRTLGRSRHWPSPRPGDRIDDVLVGPRFPRPPAFAGL